MQYSVCPKCGAESEPAEKCSQCGIFYAKWFKAQLKPDSGNPEAREESTQRSHGRSERASFAGNWLIKPWTHVEDRVNLFEFAARIGLLAGMAIWGWLLIQTNPRVTTGLFPELSFYTPVISSFVLVFHEAGHVIFSFFGRFMAVAGGTLLQLLVPLLLMAAFVYKYRNPFGAAVAMWLLGYAFIDAAPYAYDAKDMQLMLLGGGTGREVGGHDWNNMLGWTNSLHLHGSVASFLDTVGEIIVIASVVLGARVVRLQYPNLDKR